MTHLERYYKWRDDGVPDNATAKEWAGILTEVFGFVFDRAMAHGDIYKHPWHIANRLRNHNVPFLTVNNHFGRHGKTSKYGITTVIKAVLVPMDEELRLADQYEKKQDDKKK